MKSKLILFHMLIESIFPTPLTVVETPSQKRISLPIPLGNSAYLQSETRFVLKLCQTAMKL
jgi:hypothetical protein